MVGMRSGSPHTGINSSALVRFMSGLQGVATAAPGAGAAKGADRLADWLDWTDAIALAAALEAPPAGPARAAPAGHAADGAAALADAINATHTALAQAIADEPAFQRPDHAAEVTDPAADAALCRQACQKHQRAALAGVAALRDQARQALRQAGPALAQLASLDALLDQALAARERPLLGALPALLERHARRQPADANADPEAGWAGHGPRLRSALLAELDLRLQPVLGMVQALQSAPQARP